MSTFGDYPDWLRVDQKVGNPLLNQFNLQVSGVTTFGPFNVGQWEATRILFEALNTNTECAILLVWTVDQAATQIINAVEASSDGQALYSETFPNEGNWLTVRLTPLVGATPMPVQITVYPKGGGGSPNEVTQGAPSINSAFTAIGAGTSVTFKGSLITPGRFEATVSADFAPAQLLVWGQRAGVIKGYWLGMRSVAGQLDFFATSVAGRYPLRASIANETAGAGNALCTVTPG